MVKKAELLQDLDSIELNLYIEYKEADAASGDARH